MNTYAYSINEEDYFGTDSEDDAHAEAISAIQCEFYEVGDEVEYWVAKTKPAMDFIDSDSLGYKVVELLNDWLFDEMGGDDNIIELSKEDQSRLGGMIIFFLKEHASITRFGIGEETKHTHIVEEI